MKCEVRNAKWEGAPKRFGAARPSHFFLLTSLLVLLQPASSFACASCYGVSDSPLAEGMNWGILSLLFIVVCVLGSVAAFFVFIIKRAAAVEAEDAALAAEPHRSINKP